MALESIDLAEIGTYQPGAVCPYASRKEVAQSVFFIAQDLGGGLYRVRRSGGGLHSVRVCLEAGVYQADCDCYDWNAYGAGFHRACVHIWRVILTRAVGVC
jgi:hypothetical protein